MEPVDRLPAHWPYEVSRFDAARVLGEVERWRFVDVHSVALNLGMEPGLVRACLDALSACGLVDPVVPGPPDSTWSTTARSLKTPVARKEALDDAAAVLGEAQKRGEARIQELAMGLGMSRKVVRRHLRTSCDAGLLRPTSHYHPRYKAMETEGGEAP